MKTIMLIMVIKTVMELVLKNVRLVNVRDLAGPQPLTYVYNACCWLWTY